MNLVKSCAKKLTFSVIFLLNSCSLIYDRYAESCNSHAYIHQALADYIKARFDYNSPVRAAIIPFAAPANLSVVDLHRPGIGNFLAWRTHASLLETDEIPILEVFNRQDWPYKKEEFFTGNFGSIAMAREAGYDLLLVGYLESPVNFKELVAYVKLMDVESGVTIYYGKVSASTLRPRINSVQDTLRISDIDPAVTYTNILTDKLGSCIAEAVTAEPEE